MQRSRWVVVAALLLCGAGCSGNGGRGAESNAARADAGQPDAAGSAGSAEGGRQGASGSGGTAGGGAAGSAGEPGMAGAGGEQPDAGTDAGALPSELLVEEVEPAARSLAAPTTAPITIRFDRPLDRATVTPRSLWTFGRWSGPVRDGEYAFSDEDRTVTLTPPRAWTAGDRVTVVLSHDLAGADGARLRPGGHAFQFWTATQPSSLVWSEIQRMTTRTTQAARTQSYGGAAADLNGDGYLDLMIVNEITADLRIFMNRADGSGMFDSFEQATIVELGQRASPSETTDFDGDGIVDLVVANLDANSLSIVLGNGDGTLAKSQDIEVAGEPRGVAVADIEGDGDIDVVNTNADGDNLSVLVNDGSGRFAELGDDAFFDAGHGMDIVHREFGLGAGDMDEDGILDLVIGAHGSSQSGSGMVINTGNGDGSFAFASKQAAQTRGWQLAVGDVNGDGHEDVVTADGALGTSSPDSVTVLLGDGAAAASVLQTYTHNIAQPFAIDLGDMDGDADLDMVVSNYGADWEILENDGSGAFTLAHSVPAELAASCAILVDIDNDGDLDAALIDEIEDVLVILQQ